MMSQVAPPSLVKAILGKRNMSHSFPFAARVVRRASAASLQTLTLFATPRALQDLIIATSRPLDRASTLEPVHFTQ